MWRLLVGWEPHRFGSAGGAPVFPVAFVDPRVVDIDAVDALALVLTVLPVFGTGADVGHVRAVLAVLVGDPVLDVPARSDHSGEGPASRANSPAVESIGDSPEAARDILIVPVVVAVESRHTVRLLRDGRVRGQRDGETRGSIGNGTARSN